MTEMMYCVPACAVVGMMNVIEVEDHETMLAEGTTM
jgi:hypothetical protein